ncbi:hypothetical protein CYY_010088 [Polysphondylium violaceum]|uniref:Uncharacterized protein n=1 Tax=Polysphondylium violaceum TaxID=133409 RepID=A0A8J4PKP9_9MYCE|nr:hypothetical protein CYY_010088 [Polysphondylium violaceum]
MNEKTKSRTEKFFITAYVFSFSTIWVPLITIIETYVFVRGMAMFAIITLYEIELIFLVYPVNHHLIIKFFNSAYNLPTPESTTTPQNISSPSNATSEKIEELETIETNQHVQP